MTTNPYQDAALDGSTPSVDIPSTEELDTLARLKAQFGNRVLATHTAHGDATALVDAAALLEIMTWLRDAEQYVMCASVTAYDDLGNDPRFYMVYHLLNMATPERIRVKVGLPEKKPVIDSVTSIWAGANYMEREVYDLMGIEFKGHPDLRRIMMPESWEGHPLRRDYPHVYEEVQFTHNAAEVAKRKPFARS